MKLPFLWNNPFSKAFKLLFCYTWKCVNKGRNVPFETHYKFKSVQDIKVKLDARILKALSLLCIYNHLIYSHIFEKYAVKDRDGRTQASNKRYYFTPHALKISCSRDTMLFENSYMIKDKRILQQTQDKLDIKCFSQPRHCIIKQVFFYREFPMNLFAICFLWSFFNIIHSIMDTFEFEMRENYKIYFIITSKLWRVRL